MFSSSLEIVLLPFNLILSVSAYENLGTITTRPAGVLVYKDFDLLELLF